jgi:hypothetical protein
MLLEVDDVYYFKGNCLMEQKLYTQAIAQYEKVPPSNSAKF